MKRYIIDNNLHLEICKNDFNLADTLDCGQCFRFTKQDDGSFNGIAFSKRLHAIQTDNEVILFNTSLEDFNDIWHSFFDLDTDYVTMKKSLEFDPTIKLAIEFAGGIRILKQDKFETLCSFIISQNNNIPRIKGSVQKLSARFGKQLIVELFAFPTISDLRGIKKSDLTDLSLGYRDDYIVDCVEKIVDGQIVLDDISTMDIVQAREKLRTIKGVGPKVAECALLFGFHRLEAFPIDTWIKKVLATYYQDGFPQQALPVAGVAQQYLFHYMRKADLN